MAILRNELKFFIHSADAHLLKLRLASVLSPDRHTKAGVPYFIRSLYFDDPSFTAYFDKANSIEKREKFRIRFYNHDPSFLRLEKKQKNGNFCMKEWEKIDLLFAHQILSEKREFADEKGKLSEEWLLKIRSNALAPRFFVDYQRTAFIYPVQDVRITIDEKLSASPFSSSLTENSALSIPILNEGESILEIKFNQFLPAHLVSLLEGVPKVRSSISKFTMCAEALY